MKLLNKKTLILISFLIALFILFWLVLKFSPYPELELFLTRQNSIRYYDRYGILLQITPLNDGLRREWSSEIKREVKDIFVFAEDRRFYRHAGVDIFSLFRAFYQNITEQRRVSGASTITMQLSRLIADNAQNTGSVRSNAALRKATEIINAMRLETRLSKDEILELYLNSLPFGFNTEGVISASRTFFAIDLDMLSPSQIFCLAVIPRRPSLYNPLENKELNLTAAMQLYSKYSQNKKIDYNINEYDWEFASSSARRFNYPFKLPHLIRHINSFYSNKGFPQSGEIRLSVDLALQNYLEGAVYGNVMRHHSSRLTNGAAVVIDNYTGEILAWVGSADFFNARDAGQVDGVLALNQPGSSMKPFLYAMALENGFKPTDIIADIQMQFGLNEVYIPRNFNERFNGPMLFRASLASSLNIPAVYLLYRQGVRNYGNLLFKLGFDSLERSIEDAGLGLALGNAPVSLLELVRAFSVFPRDGIYLPVTWELINEDMQNINESERIFSADTARIICSFLSDSNARVLAFGAGRNFRTSFPAIFKTGTANQFQSITALGATTRYSAGVWMGNFTGETVIGRTGSSVPAAIVRDALYFLQPEHGDYDFPAPENFLLRRICSLSGMTPNNACLSIIEEFIEIGEIENPCTWHQFAGGRIETIFPAEYQSWLTATNRQGIIDHSSTPLEIISPRDGSVYLSGQGIGINEIPVQAIGGEEDILHVTHNGNSFAVERPFIFNLPRVQGINRLHIQNGREESEVVFTVQ